MKKIFTLAALAAVSLFANAQTEKWSAATGSTQTVEKETGEIEYQAVGVANEAYNTTGEQGQASVVKIEGQNFYAEHVSGPIAGFKDAEGLDPSVEGQPARGILEENVDNTWAGPKAQKLSKTGTINPLVYMQGKGNPVNLDLVLVEQIYTEGEATGRFRANWESSYYKPDGSTMGPKNGTYFSIVPKTDGVVKVGIWTNKGSRELYVCDNTDFKAKAYGTDVKVEGFINGTSWKEEDEGATEELIGFMKFQDNIKTKAEIAIEENPEAVPAEGDYYIIGKGNQASWVWLTFNVKAGVTYYVFNKNTQVGLLDIEFTGGGSEGKVGDVNEDGVINTADAIAIVNNVIGKPQDKFNAALADVNGDGVVNTADAIAVVNIVIGK